MDETLMKYLKPSDEAAYKKEMEKAQGDYAAAEDSIKKAIESGMDYETSAKLAKKLASSSARVLEIENKYKKLAQENQKADERNVITSGLNVILKLLKYQLPALYKTAQVIDDPTAYIQLPQGEKEPPRTIFSYVTDVLNQKLKEEQQNAQEHPEDEFLQFLVNDLHNTRRNYKRPSDYFFSNYVIIRQIEGIKLKQLKGQTVGSMLIEAKKYYPKEYQAFLKKVLDTLGRKNEIVAEAERKEQFDKSLEAGTVRRLDNYEITNYIVEIFDQISNTINSPGKDGKPGRPCNEFFTVYFGRNRTAAVGVKIEKSSTKEAFEKMTAEELRKFEYFTPTDTDTFKAILSCINDEPSLDENGNLHIPISAIAQKYYHFSGYYGRGIEEQYIRNMEEQIKVLLNTRFSFKDIEEAIKLVKDGNKERYSLILQDPSSVAFLEGHFAYELRKGKRTKVFIMHGFPYLMRLILAKQQLAKLDEKVFIFPGKSSAEKSRLADRLINNIVKKRRELIKNAKHSKNPNQIPRSTVFSIANLMAVAEIDRTKNPRVKDKIVRDWIEAILNHEIRLWEENKGKRGADESFLPIADFEFTTGAVDDKKAQAVKKGERKKRTGVRIYFDCILPSEIKNMQLEEPEK